MRVVFLFGVVLILNSSNWKWLKYKCNEWGITFHSIKRKSSSTFQVYAIYLI